MYLIHSSKHLHFLEDGHTLMFFKEFGQRSTYLQTPICLHIFFEEFILLKYTQRQYK
jgi:hypothetical protein